jgi:KaiC/GvpD/RAD55 family RecA-like ATPase
MAAPPEEKRRATRPVQATPPSVAADEPEGETADEDFAAARAEAPGVAPAVPVAETDVELISTGITGLDTQFGGGIPQAALYLITSSPTTATETFLAQFAAAGLLAGDAVYYFSLENPIEEIETHVNRFLRGEEAKGELHVIDGYPRQFRDVPADARRRLKIPEGVDLLAALENLLVDQNLGPPVRIIIESLSSLLEQYPPERVFRVLRVLRVVTHRLPAAAVMTLVSELHDARTITMAKHLADGVIEFAVERKGFGIYPYIAITKMRNVTGSARLLVFKETEQGLWLESTKRVY